MVFLPENKGLKLVFQPWVHDKVIRKNNKHQEWNSTIPWPYLKRHHPLPLLRQLIKAYAKMNILYQAMIYTYRIPRNFLCVLFSLTFNVLSPSKMWQELITCWLQQVFHWYQQSKSLSYVIFLLIQFSTVFIVGYVCFGALHSYDF